MDERFMSFYAAEDLEAQSVQLPAGWEAATKFKQLSKLLVSERARRAAEDLAVRAILRRARDLLRHASRPKISVPDEWPAEGEIDLDATIEAGPLRRPEEIAVVRTEPAHVPAVAMLDMSLSMTGEKLALVAVSAAILRLALDRLAVVVFDTTAHRLARIDESVPPRDLVRRILTFPAHGHTNIEAGLIAGLREFGRQRGRDRVGVMLTDGVANAGSDPVPVARRYPRLHLVQFGKPTTQGTRTCRALAKAGRGEVWAAPEFEDLPGTVRELVREVFRR
jgi:Mg-chelatase subunit ChlD